MSQKNARVNTGECLAQDIEERLAAYYGPALPPRLLSEDAWSQLRDQLGPQTQWSRQRGLRPRVPGFARARWRGDVPTELREVYGELLMQTRYRVPAPDLRCRFSSSMEQPRVHISPLGRGRISLALPQQSWQTLRAAELEMLLAAGLARCASVSRPLFLLPRVVFTASFLLLLSALPFTGLDRRALWILLAAFVCCVASGSLLALQQRALAFRGDRQAVQWLGRERVCQGLHLLAEHSRPQRRPAWGEPSLAERIARVCCTPLTEKDKRLTLVG